MLHAKLFMRCLAWGRWLLAAGLVLGWSGEAEAQEVPKDLVLSVNPNTVREDAGPTNVSVKVRVNDDTAVTEDTFVILSLSTATGLNSRFRITLPTLKILKGKKEGKASIIFTPIRTNKEDDDIDDEDLTITIEGSAGSKTVATTTIELIDSDKESTDINLSFSDADLSKRDGATDIVVTATLNGKKLKKDVRFSLVIVPKPSTATTSTAAVRDIDYSATLATITIPDRRVSGRATITIRPKNVGVGDIWIGASDDVGLTNDDGNSIVVNPSSIEIIGDPTKELTGLTAAPFSIREDAGLKEITLRVSLQNALLTDEMVQFTITDESDGLCEDSDSDCAFDGAVDAQRDVDYSAVVQSLIIPKGETEGTATITVTPVNNKKEDPPRAFTVNARIGNEETYSEGILITDDDTPSDSITLEVSPDEINEEAGATEVAVTGTLNGKEFDNDVVVLLVINDDINRDGTVNDEDKAATRDADYTAILSPLVIPGGSVSGTTTITITPIDDDVEEDDEKIGLRTLESRPPIGRDDDDLEELDVTPVTITLKDTDDEDQRPEPKDPKIPAFAAADSIADQEYEVGKAIAALVLPEATGGDGDLTYNVSILPAGLSFDSATRTISGTPTKATDGEVKIIYTVIDADRDAAASIFSITVKADETPPPLPPAADAQLTAVPSSIREDAEATQISLTVTLKAAKATAEKVTFTLVDPSEGTSAVRDVDYTAILGAVVSIPAGATVGTATLSLTPTDNTRLDGPRMLGVQAAFASGGTLLTNIEIADDETPSTSIVLSVSPSTVSEEGDQSTIMVTATLNGKALLEDATVTVAIDDASTAMRDVDYVTLFDPRLVIPAGSTTGSTIFAVRPIDDTLAEGNETIKLIGTIAGLMGDEVEITLSDRAAVLEEELEETSLAFSDDALIEDQEYTAGSVIADLVLPAATGGDGDLTYSVSVLPAGLSFDAATRTISGTPPEATDGAVNVIYTAIDGEKAAAVLTFSITVNAPLEFDLKGFFNFFSGVGKANPTSDPTMLATIDDFVVGQRVAGLVLPAGTGGTAPLMYSLSPGLPVGLSFDPVARTISGMPTAESQPVYTYTVTDAHGVQASLSLQTRPTTFALADNYPNPFNPSTTIRYALPEASDVELTVYNVAGQAVRTLVSEQQSAGRYVVEWDATNDSGHRLSSGLYFYRLEVGGQFHDVKKMLLLK